MFPSMFNMTTIPCAYTRFLHIMFECLRRPMPYLGSTMNGAYIRHPTHAWVLSSKEVPRVLSSTTLFLIVLEERMGRDILSHFGNRRKPNISRDIFVATMCRYIVIVLKISRFLLFTLVITNYYIIL